MDEFERLLRAHYGPLERFIKFRRSGTPHCLSLSFDRRFARCYNRSGIKYGDIHL